MPLNGSQPFPDQPRDDPWGEPGGIQSAQDGLWPEDMIVGVALDMLKV